jgi:hypothetical protein
MVTYSFVPPFRETKFCGVPECVFDKLGVPRVKKGRGTLSEVGVTGSGSCPMADFGINSVRPSNPATKF